MHIINVFHLCKHCIAGALLLRPDMQHPVALWAWHPPILLDPGPAKSCRSCFAFKLILLDCNIFPRKGSGYIQESGTDITFFSVRCH